MLEEPVPCRVAPARTTIRDRERAECSGGDDERRAVEELHTQPRAHHCAEQKSTSEINPEVVSSCNVFVALAHDQNLRGVMQFE